MARNRISGMSTGETVALVGGGLLLAWFFLKPATPVAPPIIVTNPSGSASTTNTLINDGSSVINSFINALS